VTDNNCRHDGPLINNQYCACGAELYSEPVRRNANEPPPVPIPYPPQSNK
jgi:hypothetical protein